MRDRAGAISMFKKGALVVIRRPDLMPTNNRWLGLMCRRAN
jgi:hypothetical protein